jgi:hypothetical protein
MFVDNKINEIVKKAEVRSSEGTYGIPINKCAGIYNERLFQERCASRKKYFYFFSEINLGACDPYGRGQKLYFFLLPSASCPLPFFGHFLQEWFGKLLQFCNGRFTNSHENCLFFSM